MNNSKRYKGLSRTKFIINELMPKSVASGAISRMVQEIADENKVLRTAGYRTTNVRCPQCYLVLGRVVTLWSRTWLKSHLLDHKIQRILGCEREWVERHVCTTGRWAHDR